MAVPPRLLRAYRQTRYTVAGMDVRIGRRSPAMDAFLTQHGARIGVLVTAWNPRSHRMPDGWNARMQQRLLRDLRRRAWFAADGAWRCWQEAHVLVLAPTAWVTRIAARFHQHGLVVVRGGRTAELVLLPHRCSGRLYGALHGGGGGTNRCIGRDTIVA